MISILRRSVLGCVPLLFAVVVCADWVELKDGLEFEGKIIRETQREVTIRTRHGVITLNKTRVKKITRNDNIPSFEEERRATTPKEPAKERTSAEAGATPTEPRGVDAPPADLAAKESNSRGQRQGTTHALGRARWTLPGTFVPYRSPAAGAMFQDLAAGEVLGQFRESTTGTVVSLARIHLPEGVPTELLKEMLWESLKLKMAQPGCHFTRGRLADHDAILAEIDTEEGPIKVHVLGAYILGAEDGIYAASVSIPTLLFQKDAERYRTLFKSFRLSS